MAPDSHRYRASVRQAVERLDAFPGSSASRDLILAVSPFESPNARLAIAASRAGAVGIVDLGRDRPAALAALADTDRWCPDGFGIRVPAGCPVNPGELPSRVGTVILVAGADTEPWRTESRRVLVEVVSVPEAAAAVAGIRGPADGLVARGSEAGGRVGELSTFLLLQRLMADPSPGLPVWAAGGVGLHTAAAAVVGGAIGVVLDVQLALTLEGADGLPADTVAALSAMDGSETTVIAGHRVLTRPDLTGGPAPERPDDMALRLGRELGPRPSQNPGWLPAGQDAAFARPLAERYRTAGGVIQAVRAAVGDHLRAARENKPLAPGGGVGRRPEGPPHPGFAFPVAQGPMTRVSDRAAFAAAVAEAGALPFLALALMSGEEVARLLAKAKPMLGSRAWGIGILGFVPADLREAQLAAVIEAGPPYALIAGGRPDQAARLEAAGIATFLHVPSPGLLDQFLALGARRFVFEGSECGGHIGPRASFPLWESQVERLLAFGAGREAGPDFFSGLEVLFAGGIHDERSGAMVAALAAPLAERGASIGVLMGTAYLFTEEAVTSGAILPGFQEAALDCAETVLLETSPGHITRCAGTPYVEAFTKARDDLIAAGASAQDLWSELERLNLGRLRIASKGVRRDGDALVQVAEDEQRETGLYMLGQVATTRSERTTLGALHRQVTEGAVRFLEEAAAERDADASNEGADPERPGRPLDVAIVGMSCVMPQADGFARYWANILAGVDAVTEVPASRWDAERYWDPDAYARLAGDGDATPSKWGGFIPPIPFDALAYGIPPSSLASIEPVQLLALEVAARAIADAGYAWRPFDRERASVVFGAEAGADLEMAYSFRTLFPAYFGPLPPELEEHLPALTEDSFAGVLANVIAGRIANRLDLGGVNFTIDAACASSLAALDAACKELAAGSSDLVLCGGADLHNGIYDYLMFASAHALSPTGRCRTFDAAADGIALGEGVACLVLKRVADAERDGDRIYAVIDAVAGSSDGRSLGLTAPRAEGQRRALERAYAAAGVDPARVGLIEAHGTGTVVGDRTELSALSDLFVEAGAAPGSCALGSVKSQIGHTKCAAGLAGVVKVAAALHAGVRPPTGPIAEPNPGWEAGASPFFFDEQARPWPGPPEERHAGVSAFGFGGTNFHAVLSGYGGAPEPPHSQDEWPAELFLVRGAGEAEAGAAAGRLADVVVANEAAGRPWRLCDLAGYAHTTQPDRSAPVQVAFVATDLDDLAAKLAVAAEGRDTGVFRRGDPEHGKVAFLFPGQGSQRPGMLSDLFVAFPRLHRHLRGGSAARYASLMFPPAPFTPAAREAQRRAITDTAIAQPVMAIGGLAVHDLLTWLGIQPDLAGGHSFGELVALAAAGAIPSGDLLGLGEARAAAILAAAGDDPGTMAAVRADEATVRAALAAILAAGSVVVANLNAPDQTVISGPTVAVAAAMRRLSDAGIGAQGIPVACAFHSPVVATAGSAFAETLESCPIAAPAYPVWSNTTAREHDGADPHSIRVILARQVAEPVRFVEQIEAMYDAGARVFVECGPGRVLTGLVGKILGDRPHTAVACEVSGEPGLARFLTALAELAGAGVAMDLTPLLSGRALRTVTPEAVPARPGWVIDGHLTRSASGEVLAGGLRPSADFAGHAPVPGDVPVASAPVPARAAADPPPTVDALTSGKTGPDAAVLAYFQATREIVAAQRDVMLSYLGAAAGPPAAGPSTEPPQLTNAPADGQPTPMPVGPQPLTEAALTEAILGIVCRRTGYPREMLGGRLDLEADLSIDSIKRTEIVMELAGQLRANGSPPPDGAVEALARLKTIDAIVEWMLEPDGDQPGPVGAADATWVDGRRSEAVVVGPPKRYRIEVVTEPGFAHEHFTDLAGRRIVVIDDEGGVGVAVATALRHQGADALLLGVHHDLEAACARTDGVIHLGALRLGDTPILPAAFAPLRAALVGGARAVLMATGSGGLFGRGIHGAAIDASPGLGLWGMARTMALEYPHAAVRAVDVDATGEPERIAGWLLGELGASGAAANASAVVGYGPEGRSLLTAVPSELAGSRPSDPGEAVRRATEALGLGPDSVVLLTGGGRGITAGCAVALAEACGCRIELIGRSPLPLADEPPEIASAPDAAALRRALLSHSSQARSIGATAWVEAEVRRLLVSRKVQATVAAVRATGSPVRYHSGDITDTAQVHRLLENIFQTWGRLDGVVHGAGVLEDRRIADKTPESFARVFSAKVDGARALAAALGGRPPLRFLAMFGSLAGAFGNPGQVDYSAANDALDTLARTWARDSERIAARSRAPAPAADLLAAADEPDAADGHGVPPVVAERIVSVDWGPWAADADGMVSPELEREFARRGVAMIAPEEGMAALFGELAWGHPTDNQVVYVAGALDAFATPASGAATS